MGFSQTVGLITPKASNKGSGKAGIEHVEDGAHTVDRGLRFAGEGLENQGVCHGSKRELGGGNGQGRRRKGSTPLDMGRRLKSESYPLHGGAGGDDRNQGPWSDSTWSPKQAKRTS